MLQSVICVLQLLLDVESLVLISRFNSIAWNVRIRWWVIKIGIHECSDGVKSFAIEDVFANGERWSSCSGLPGDM